MKNYQKFAILSLALFIAFGPTISYAHEKKARINSEVKIEKVEKKCARAFGHFFARGYWKKHNKPELSQHNCFVPFGIKKRFQGQASTTPDIIPPVISRVAATTSTTTASIYWHTNENSDSKVFFGTVNPVNTSATSTTFVGNADWKMNHFITLSGLTASTTYYLAIESSDQSGNKTTTPTFSIITR